MENLREILELHGKYIRGDVGGVRADLRVADLRGADLRVADLRGADLRGADLREADLSVADLTNTISDFTIFKSISGLKYPIVIKDNLIRMGCQEYTLEEWNVMTMTDLDEMDGINAINFYSEIMPLIRAIYNKAV